MDPVTIILFIKKYWKVAVLAILIGAIFYEGFTIGAEREARKCQEGRYNLTNAIAKVEKERDAIALKYEQEKANIKVVTNTVVKTVTKEIEKPVYRECVVPPTGVAVLGETVAELNKTRVDLKVDKTLLIRLKEKLKNEQNQ